MMNSAMDCMLPSILSNRFVSDAAIHTCPRESVAMPHGDAFGVGTGIVLMSPFVMSSRPM